MESVVEGCPHRRPVPEAGPGTAECGLLRRLTGVEDGRLCRVRLEACVACREGSTPSESHLNPALASLLYDLAGDVARRGGAPGCGLDEATRLRGWAEEQLFLGCAPEPVPAGGPGPSRRPPARARRRGRRPRIGLVGWNTPSGLGTVNRGIARNLPIDRWLIPRHGFHRELSDAPPCPVRRGTGPAEVRAFLRGLDWLLFCERPYLGSLVATARHMGVRVACVPMWEYLDEMSPWIRGVDLMLCPTRYCHDRLAPWRERLGLRCELAMVPWPIEPERFAFRPRSVCRRFLFVNGAGGARAVDQETPEGDGRKGIWIVAEAARRAPTVSILVRSQTGLLPPLPGNVEVRLGDLDDPAELYREGDVCIQPSRWEGLGLPLLECQASGLPLITTDAPPMNEHRPLRALRASATTIGLPGGHTIPAHEVDPVDLAEALLRVQGSDISEASLAARRFVEAEHSWAAVGPKLLERFAAP